MYFEDEKTIRMKRTSAEISRRLRIVPRFLFCVMLATLALSTSSAIAGDDLAETLGDLLAANGDEMQPVSYTFEDRGGTLKIETRCAKQSNGDSVRYNLSFPGTPYVVVSAQNGKGVAACACTVTKSGFKLAMRDHAGNAVSNAWVLWIAVYPRTYKDSATGLEIATGCQKASDNGQIPYNFTFSDFPVVVANAQKDGKAKIAATQSTGKTCFNIDINDDNGKAVSDAWVLWLAVYPSQYKDPNSNLQIETARYNQQYPHYCGVGHWSKTTYRKSFPGTAVAVTTTSGNSWDEPCMSCPVNIGRTGFTWALTDHTGASATSEDGIYIAVYPGTFQQKGRDADFDGDGIVDANDLLAILAAWGNLGDVPEDISGDGIVDESDLIELLKAWENPE